MASIPKIISVDDHIVEPPTLWTERLPAKYRDRGPRVERKFGQVAIRDGKTIFDESVTEGPHVGWSDVWLYEDLAWPLHAGYAQYGIAKESRDPVTYDEIDPACWKQDERLKAMDVNHTEASICFPTVPRFCGQTFYERQDKEFALVALQAWNDYILDEWCAGGGKGRLIPLSIIPLWDADLAAAEVRRTAAKGTSSIAFSEAPHALGLPTIYSGYWEPLWKACDETGTTVNMHIGSSSRMPSTSPDAPQAVGVTLNVQNSIHAAADWVWSGLFARYPNLKIALAEGQVGWMPFFYERMDSIWRRADMYEGNVRELLPEPPSTYARRQIFGCIFEDFTGLGLRDVIGMNRIMLEIDFPHSDSTYPNTAKVASEMALAAGLTEEETHLLVRGAAIDCYNLGRYGITA